MDRDYIRITSADPDDPEPKTLLNLKTSWCVGEVGNTWPDYDWRALYRLANGEWLILFETGLSGARYLRVTAREAADWCVAQSISVPPELEGELEPDCIGVPSSESPGDVGEPWGAEGFVELPNGDIGVVEASWPSSSEPLTDAEREEFERTVNFFLGADAPATKAPPNGPDIEAAIAEAAARNEALSPDERRKLDNLFGQAGKPRKVSKAEAEKLAHKYLFVDKRPWPGVRTLAAAINYHESRVVELPSVRRHKEEHPEQWPNPAPKAVGISDANEASISVGERHGVLNDMIAKEEAELELQRLADERRELEKAEERLAELARETAEQLGQMRADNAPPKYMGKAVGRRRKS